jgi:hypothetical protein
MGRTPHAALDPTVDEVVAHAAETVPRRHGRRVDMVDNAAHHIERRELGGEAMARQRLPELIQIQPARSPSTSCQSRTQSPSSR